MKTAKAWLVDVRAKLALDGYINASKYRIAKALRVSEATVTLWEKGAQMDDASALKIAGYLEIDPHLVLISAAWSRAKSDAAVKKAWESLAKKAAGVAAAVFVLTWSIGAQIQPAFDITKIIDPSAPEYTLCAIVLWIILVCWSAISMAYGPGFNNQQKRTDHAPAIPVR